MGRKFIGVELKTAYYQQALKNLKRSKTDADSLLAGLADPRDGSGENEWM
jgi:hypothetical protein